MNLATHRTRPLWPALALAVWLAAPLAQAQQECPAGITPNTPDSDFAGAGAGMVLHKPTGLVWKRCAEGQSWDGSTCTGTAAGYTWQQAFERVDAVNAAAAGTQNLGATDWRLPNVNELKSIAELACRNPAINLTQFPAVSGWGFWSGSPNAGYPVSAWLVDFYDGNVSWDYRDFALAVRLVRGGQSMLSFDAAAGGGSGGTVAAVPTLGEWGLVLLGLLAAGMGARRLRRG